MKRIISVILIVAMAAATFAGCSSGETGEKDYSVGEARAIEPRSEEEIEATGVQKNDVITALDDLLYKYYTTVSSGHYAAAQDADSVNFVAITPVVRDGEYVDSDYRGDRAEFTQLGDGYYSDEGYGSEGFDEQYDKYLGVEAVGINIKVAVYNGKRREKKDISYIRLPRYYIESLFDTVGFERGVVSEWWNAYNVSYKGTNVDVELIEGLSGEQLEQVYREFIPMLRKVLLDRNYEPFIDQYEVFFPEEKEYDDDGRLASEKYYEDGAFAGWKAYWYRDEFVMSSVTNAFRNIIENRVTMYYPDGKVKMDYVDRDPNHSPNPVYQAYYDSEKFKGTEYEFDVRGRIDPLIEGWYEGAWVTHVVFYDEQGRAIRESGGQRSDGYRKADYEYDDKGELCRYTEYRSGYYDYESGTTVNEWTLREDVKYPGRIETYYTGYEELVTGDSGSTGWSFVRDEERCEAYRFEYDDEGRIVKAIEIYDENDTFEGGVAFRYDDEGRLVKEYGYDLDFYGKETERYVYEFKYNDKGLPVSYELNIHHKTEHSKQFVYDDDGMLEQVIVSFGDPNDLRYFDEPLQGLVNYPYALVQYEGTYN